jgi:hypothetical protein
MEREQPVYLLINTLADRFSVGRKKTTNPKHRNISDVGTTAERLSHKFGQPM